MVRRSGTTQLKTEPASLPEVLVSPSQAKPNERDAYWLQLIQDPAQFKAAIATEDFWPMLRKFPESLWTDGRLSLYLYRRPDDEGLMIKNPEGAKKYSKVLHEPIDEEYISRNHGGGKYTLYLKLDSDTTLRECTFMIDGVPKAKAGQIVEIAGKPVQVAGAPTPASPDENSSALSKVIDANSRANESGMTILAHASKTAIDMVKEQATTNNAPQDPFAMAVKLVELMRQPAPAADPVQQELMKQIIAKAFAEPKATEEREEKPTPIQQTLDAVKELTGGMSLPELMKPASRAAAADPVAGWAPIVSAVSVALGNILEKAPLIMQQRNEGLRLEIQLRSMQTGQPVPQQLLAAPAKPQPGPQAVPNPPSAQDPGQIITLMVQRICNGFDRHRDSGEDVAAALAVEFGEAIESMGLEKTLSSSPDMQAFIAGVPALAQRTQDARWPEFYADFMGYTQDRWGVPDDGKESAQSEASHGPEPVLA
jgi:hypothetical protein